MFMLVFVLVVARCILTMARAVVMLAVVFTMMVMMVVVTAAQDQAQCHQQRYQQFRGFHVSSGLGV